MADPSVSVSMGIVATGMFLPERVMSAAEIADASGMPEWVVREKLGIEQKHVADPEIHPNEMALRAAESCLASADLDPAEIDVVLCTTEEWKEYALWTAGIDLATRSAPSTPGGWTSTCVARRRSRRSSWRAR